MDHAVGRHDVAAHGLAHGRVAVRARVVHDDRSGVGHPGVLAREHGHQTLFAAAQRQHEDRLHGKFSVAAVKTVDDVVVQQVLHVLLRAVGDLRLVGIGAHERFDGRVGQRQEGVFAAGLGVVLLHAGVFDGRHELAENVRTGFEILPRRHRDVGVEHRVVVVGVGLQFHVAAGCGQRDRQKQRQFLDYGFHGTGRFGNYLLVA